MVASDSVRSSPLAAFDALTREGQNATGDTLTFSDSVCRVAMAIEAFHKASLVHDDIQDDDLFRYGRQTLHRTQGMGPAINIGDYLIGLGVQAGELLPWRFGNRCRL
jgi:geranylgeranyl diphosphate synthase type II